VESPQNSKGLIFNNYSKSEKSMSCLIFYFNSTTDIGLKLVALDRGNSKLSNNTHFINFGPVDLEIKNF
jgi:hypothetical protein